MPVGDGELILVVDDEIAIREITKATLEAHGYRVTTANDGTDALALYAQHRGEIQAVVIDMMMPILDGPATIRALQKLDPNARVIAVSGLAANGKAAEATALGMRAFLPKPYTAERLLTTLRELLERTTESGSHFFAETARNGFSPTRQQPVGFLRENLMKAASAIGDHSNDGPRRWSISSVSR